LLTCVLKSQPGDSDETVAESFAGAMAADEGDDDAAVDFAFAQLGQEI
jgi:hypothetical protein